MALTPKQELFCLEYLKDLNGTQAAIRAGYAKESAQEQASRLLSNAMVAARVHEQMQARAERVQVDADWVLTRLVMVAERCATPGPKLVMTMAGLQQAKDPVTGEGIFEFDAIGANKALELIGKHVGLFEKHNKQKNGEVHITIGGKAAGQQAEDAEH
ncbi:terminase small subunit [Hymenobacter sp. 15J16-1T3B]|uniref:terminase small subunit n=1 Tax=Hymenobacter sp. 15J16-1T3B TaxID=2886941 RepID=UPI001D1222D8|nr:terminase small subunit [Hymenobacter sp. 15J16-1T3B]MCC3159693.1 terminase small subunit [Hymenobacter sp. 15J16-1T3B]